MEGDRRRPCVRRVDSRASSSEGSSGGESSWRPAGGGRLLRAAVDDRGHPIALTEAWLASVPTVYADWPFAAEMRARHGAHPGTVVPINGTPEQWATAVVQSRHIDTDFARGLAWQHYTAPRMAQQWEDLILR